MSATRYSSSPIVIFTKHVQWFRPGDIFRRIFQAWTIHPLKSGDRILKIQEGLCGAFFKVLEAFLQRCTKNVNLMSRFIHIYNIFSVHISFRLLKLFNTNYLYRICFEKITINSLSLRSESPSSNVSISPFVTIFTSLVIVVGFFGLFSLFGCYISCFFGNLEYLSGLLIFLEGFCDVI